MYGEKLVTKSHYFSVGKSKSHQDHNLVIFFENKMDDKNEENTITEAIEVLFNETDGPFY